MRKAFLAASALTLALSAGAWAQSTPPAATTGLNKPATGAVLEPNPAPAPNIKSRAGETTPSAGSTGGPVVQRSTGGVGVNQSAGSSTPAAGTTGASVPVRNSTAPLPSTAAGLPQNQYVLQMGERLREWFPLVDTYLDAGIPPPRANLQAQVREAWEKVRAEWDQLQSADTAGWDAARSEFETAYTNFEHTWDEAQRKT